jgi:hypothetical protein
LRVTRTLSAILRAAQADEFGAFLLAMIVEPVGIDEPDGRVVRILHNRLEQGFVRDGIFARIPVARRNCTAT